ncbi:MAG: hypothetical protein HQ477_09150 [Chloroflexi bacterium]|mgnify:CR=1 FL=1|nr:hypothetical protein [Chloroflexota bacterium]
MSSPHCLSTLTSSQLLLRSRCRTLHEATWVVHLYRTGVGGWPWQLPNQARPNKVKMIDVAEHAEITGTLFRL